MWGRKCKDIGGSTPKNMNFFYFDICDSPIFLSFQNRAILYSTIATFEFMVIYVKGVSSNIWKNALCTKNGYID